MSKERKTAISPKRHEDYPEWYQQVVRSADLAETSPVRGCMVIKPWGYALWENMRTEMDKMFSATGHVNAYFPLFIPLRFLQKEAEHVDGFAKECAVITHHRLEADSDGNLVPAGELEEPLVVRPTSETIIGETYAKWVQSYRDLPILINQWANVVRWEMRPRIFLRTAEFLWQEGHTVHETREEAWEETVKMLDVYKQFAEEYMAMPVLTGEKTEGERFPGAENTFCIEAMMQDRKALQAGTSHFLGQNFAKSAEIMFQDRNGQRVHAWTTSWGVSTRLIGGMIMIHGDDDGFVVPPRLAPKHVVILPIIKDDGNREEVLDYCSKLAADISHVSYHGSPVRVEVDDRDINTGEKGWSWIKRGIPIRLEVGPRDIANDSVFMARRDLTPKEKAGVKRDEFIASVVSILDEMQAGLFEKAKAYRDDNTIAINKKDEFYAYFTPENKDKPEIHGGFALSHWCTSPDCEKQANDDLSVTIRCIPSERDEEKGECVICGNDSPGRVVFAKSY
ncbi:proline--tRNA ligase [bacterium E08(2017)]|nr:proline--tRNA ligase [bacterium E08(2017)]